jgi:hypothetical protein
MVDTRGSGRPLDDRISLAALDPTTSSSMSVYSPVTVSAPANQPDISEA